MATPVQVEIAKSAIGHADGLTQWAFLLNGGAAAGLLTFLGNAIKSKGDFTAWPSFSTAMLCFVIGLLITVASRFFTFLALNFFSQVDDRHASGNLQDIEIYLIVGDRGTICAVISFALFTIACLLFCAGVLYGRHAIFG